MSSKVGKYNLVYVVSVFIFVMCANQGFPPGGPIDRTPPAVLETHPAHQATDVPTETRIEIEFTETVDQKSVEPSLFITPFSGKVEYKWKGRKLLLDFQDELRDDRTYVVTIGSDTRDLRNNPMQNSFTLAFSTGDQLDEARITGTVYGKEETGGIQVWAYDLNEIADPNPSKDQPLYITQSGQDGKYSLGYMAFSEYRLFAVMDRDRNTYYDPEYDLMGIGPGDVELSESVKVIDNYNFRVTRRDTTAPVLVDGTAIDQHHVDIRFSENMSAKYISDPDNYLVETTVDTMVIYDVYPDYRNSSYVHLTTSRLTQGEEYRLFFKKAIDLAGNKLDSTHWIGLTGTSIPDTISPELLFMNPKDSSKNIPLDQNIECIFSETMNQESVEQSWLLMDSLNNQVSGQFLWENGAHLVFDPDSILIGNMVYTLSMPVDSVFDFYGNKLMDTLFVKNFMTLDPDTLSSISGMITDQNRSAKGYFYLHAHGNTDLDYYIRVEDNEEYHFENIMPGLYIIDIFRDADRDSEYSYGQVYPYHPAERYYVYPDTVSIRSGWPNEGNDIRFPSPGLPDRTEK